MIKNIFLTGKKHSGKTTLLENLVRKLSEQHPELSVAGFQTKKVRRFPEDACVYMLPPLSGDLFCVPENLLFRCLPKGQRPCADTERETGLVFDRLGMERLADAEESDLILLDEIGPHELCAEAFCRRISALLDGPVPVFGVLQEEDADTKGSFSGVFETIPEREDTLFLTVTPENRGQLQQKLERCLEEIVFPCSFLSAVIMASGHAKRFGSDKLLTPFRGIPLIEHTFRTVRKAGFGKTAVVSRKETVLSLAEPYGFLPVKNTDTTDDTAVTIRLGIEQAGSARGIAFFVADQPLLKPQTVRSLCRLFLQNPSRICSLSRSGKRGNPAVFPQTLFPELSSLPKDGRGNDIIKRHPELLLLSEAADDAEIFDIDTPEDLAVSDRVLP